MKKILSILVLSGICSGMLFTSCKLKKDMNKEFDAFLKSYEEKVIPLYKEVSLASWNAENTGKDEDFAKAEELQIKLSRIYTSKTDFAKLKEIKESNQITDPIKKRELDVIYNAYLGNQVDSSKLEAIIKLETEITKKYNSFRVVVNGDTLTDNDVEEKLQTSTDNKELQAVWEASKQLGPVVAADIVKLVKLRNEVAKELGFNNYHEMSLKLSDQEPQDITNLFAELDNLTRDKFAQLKDGMDSILAAKVKVKKEELMPWNYQNRFFQEAPDIYTVNFDVYYKGKNQEDLTNKYFKGIGLPVDSIMNASDLYERENKCQHAFCTHLDRFGDVRILCNIKENSYWMATMLHEFGHGVYDKYLDYKLPFTLREPAHTFTTEAIAMLFGRMATNGQWMKDNLGISEEEKVKIADIAFRKLQLEQLTFSRWSQVMYNFEKNLYANPDQDLNKLWWDLCEKYQMIKRPANRNMPDWATKTHIANSPCYYHNYHLGELLASQLHFNICKNILKTEDLLNQSYTNNNAVGQYLKDKVFAPGSSLMWNDMIEKATGEKLTAKYYAKQFVGK